MSTYVLIHGAGSDSWYWHRVVPQLRALGHDVVAVDLPCDDDAAGLEEYVDTVVEAVGDRRDLILVAQSLGGFTAPLVCERLPVTLLVLVAAMTPRPGESPGEWWANTGHEFPTRSTQQSSSLTTYRPSWLPRLSSTSASSLPRPSRSRGH
jgi:pimeloyl-ACP methyl ester carboxylesterase